MIEPAIAYFNICMRSSETSSIKDASASIDIIESKLGMTTDKSVAILAYRVSRAAFST